METPSDGQGFKTKEKPAGERPDIVPVPLNANAPGVGRATPTDQDREQALDNPHVALMKELLAVIERTRVGCGKGPAKEIDQIALTQLSALCELAEYVQAKLDTEREAAYRAGQEEMKDRAWREIDIKWGPDASGLIQVLAIEPPPSEGKA